jgi:hypothetical protein
MGRQVMNKKRGSRCGLIQGSRYDGQGRRCVIWMRAAKNIAFRGVIGDAR